MKKIMRIVSILIIVLISASAHAQKISTDAVLGSINFSLKPDVLSQDFDKYAKDEYIPSFEKHFPGVKVFLLKKDRGAGNNGYGFLLIFESVEERNKWWPQSGNSSDKCKAALAKIKEKEEKLNSMINYDSFTDWLVL